MNTGETDLQKIIRTLKPQLHEGDFVFCTVDDLHKLNSKDILMTFRESESITVIIKKEIADDLKLNYTFVSAWITLSVHSSLTAVGLTAAFSSALTREGISCNVVAAFYHDHIFVDRKDAVKAMSVLESLAKD